LAKIIYNFPYKNYILFIDLFQGNITIKNMEFKFISEEKKADFETFKKVLEGKEKAKRVHFAELLFDYEIKKYISEKYFGRKWIDFSYENIDDWTKQEIYFWYQLGYDYARISGGLDFEGKGRVGEDTAVLSRGQRGWVEENKGVISNWDEFEKYPWPKINEIDYKTYEITSKNLPEGMKMVVCPSSGVFEISSEKILGFENMSYLIYENYELVEAVFNKVGQLMVSFYENIVEIDNVEGFFQGDDLGFKTSTFLSPFYIRKLVIPFHKKFSQIAHEKGKMYFLHCCGNVLEIMNDFIYDVKIDAFHSFQDEIIPVWEFKELYDEKIGILGGIDVNKLCTYNEENLRKYVRRVLDQCMPERYALGSGNSIANYIPVQNFLIMLDEGWKYK